MNTTKITATARTLLVAATLGVATLTVSACTDQVEAPPQDIRVELPEPEVKTFEPACNTRAAVKPCLDRPPAGSGIAPQK